MLNLILTLIVLAVVAFAAVKFVMRYREAEGSPWQKALTAAKGSATVLWQYAIMAGSFLMAGASQLGDAANMPEIRTFIQAKLSPEMFAGVLFAVALVTIFARLRSLVSGK